jgi:glycosyltransferase involved in cell wall biosynthesis
MQHHKEVTVLMATYNGGVYLTMQLDSILEQSYTNWKLVIRDDGSTDATLEIIERYINKDTRISRIDYGDLHGSACKNFSQLASWATGYPTDYLMFSDQDDIWATNKIAVSMEEIDRMEQLYGKSTPLLCYSNFQFINDQGTELPQKLILPAHLELRVLLNENHAWGCTMIINRAALKAIVQIPVNAVNHDYWISLVVTALGKTRLIEQELIFYRQHLQNVSGNVGNMKFTSRLKRYVTNNSFMITALTANLTTVKLFYQRYQGLLSAGDKKMVGSFISDYQKGSLRLMRTIFKYRIFKIGLAKNAIYWYTLFLLRRKVVSQTSVIN